jgi:DNA polymerase III subunit alpha
VTDFAHLHLHTEYSLLDGMGRISEYIERAKETGLHHLAITDHGVLYAAMDWYRQVSKAGLHPIIGMEAYFAEGRASAKERKSYHLLLLAENTTGYRNLLKLASKASLEGFYYRPRVDIDMLAEHSSGLIATSACLGGPVANNILHGNPDAARDYAGKLGEIFGRDRFYIEIQDHGMKDQIDTNKGLLELASSFDLPLVATNDVHYCNQADAAAQEILVCIQTNTTLSDPKRLKPDTDQLYLKSPQEMAEVFRDLPEALRNTMHIAEMCQLDLVSDGYQLPDFHAPDGLTNEVYLDRICRQGAIERYGRCEGEIEQRLNYELRIINEMGFTNYFLVVWDFVRFAKEQGILVGPGRGSAAGSIVTYALGITALDPLKYNLLFERFLNPSRISMPDIDIDFADDRRDEVIEYVVQKYGDDRVAQITTFGTMAAKGSVRDVGRAMGVPFSATDKVAKLIPVGPNITIEIALKRVPELRALYESDQILRELIDNARKVEGIARHASTHAAGVVISRDPLVDHVPLQRAGGKSEGEVTTQYPMGQLEDIGLLKMDFLGLTTLTILGRAVELARRKNPDLTLDEIPLHDEAAYELLRRGDTVGIFQLEGSMTTRMTVDVAPESFEDLIALMALIRPGPMEMAPDYISRKHGRTPIEYMHADLEPILRETYGIALYQEQIMQIANVLAGFSMAEGDGLRKAMGKKLPEEMAKYRGRFVDGCVEHGLTKSLSIEIFDMIERFAGYGFNKAHSAAYAVIAAQTAYLKANYPVEFMAALLSTDTGNTERVMMDVAESRRMGIEILPPDVNRSGFDFQVETQEDGEEVVRFGLSAIRNVGAGAARSIIEARESQPEGIFSDLELFCDAVDWGRVSKRVADSLAKSGALDGFGARHSILDRLESSITAAVERQRAAARGQMGLALFESSTITTVPKAGSERNVTGEEIPLRERLGWERDLLGVYLSDHPVTEVIRRAGLAGRVQIGELADRPAGEKIKVVGMINNLRRIITKANRSMAVIEFEDPTGSIELVAFPDCYEQYVDLWQVDQVLEVEARVDRRNDKLQLVCENASMEISAPETSAPESEVHITIPLGSSFDQDIAVMQRVDQVLRSHEGDDEVFIHLATGKGEILLRSRTLRVEANDVLERALCEVIGVERVLIQSLVDEELRLISA